MMKIKKQNARAIRLLDEEWARVNKTQEIGRYPRDFIRKLPNFLADNGIILIKELSND